MRSNEACQSCLILALPADGGLGAPHIGDERSTAQMGPDLLDELGNDIDRVRANWDAFAAIPREAPRRPGARIVI